jgi:hypothetical protein
MRRGRVVDAITDPLRLADEWLLELDADGLIERLRIVYDTVDVRPAFERDTGGRSWRPSDSARR